MRAVIFGHALTALIQGTLVGIGFAIADCLHRSCLACSPRSPPSFPPLGTGLVLVPAVLYLLFAGRWGAAIFLGIWSIGVGFSDNFLRPYLTQQRAKSQRLRFSSASSAACPRLGSSARSSGRCCSR